MKVYLGIDWSQDTHAACFVNETGRDIARLSLPHSLDGLDKLDRARAQLGVTPDECWVGIETAHSLVVDFLWARQPALDGQSRVLSPVRHSPCGY